MTLHLGKADRRNFAWNLVLVWVVANLLAVSPALGQAAAPATSWADAVLTPFWASPHMVNETLFFVKMPHKRHPEAKLLFVPSKMISVTSADGATVFEEGRDYLRKKNSNLITLPRNSRIPTKTWAELHPPMGSPGTLGEAVGGKTTLFFDPTGAVLHTIQVAVTYDHDDKWSGYVPQSGEKEIPRSIAKLRGKEKLKLVFFGDSISVGAGASGMFHAPPNQPPYVPLVEDGLRSRFGGDITVKNISEGGQDTTWGVTTAPKVAEEDPDLVLIAFGMNDAGRAIPAAAYAQNIQKMIDTIRQKHPHTEFLLVTTMIGNAEWAQLTFSRFAEYREALTRMVGPGIAIADVTSVWQDVLKTKKFLDFTGNGLNHPNDFGHRIYAQVILQVLQ
ncbi:MAG: SGNH/GDSL hydrolase family protein [Acidobacteria bacterium]|jgi:lysophospholipase L1-like esterase|nr:SGNH/GDSL hydrolase family protein [Acidobacteriota bacterium]